MKHTTWSMLITAGMLTVFTAGCEPEPQVALEFKDLAYGKVGDPIPAGAKLVGAQEMLELYESGRIHLVQSVPTFISASVDAEVTHQFTDRFGQTQTVTLISPEAVEAGRKEAAQKFSTHENQLALYRSLRLALNRSSLGAHHFPSAEAAVSLSKDDLSRLNDTISARADEIIKLSHGELADAVDPSTLPPLVCGQEEGAGKAWDRTGSWSSCTHKSGGLMANYSFPAKPYLPCVKNQAARGTCVAFGLTSAAETLTAQDTGRRVNYSEQDLYNSMKLWWNFSQFGDGASGLGSARNIVTKGYEFMPESFWNYNTSSRRLEDNEHKAYAQSCDNYNEDCSDTVHQGQLMCAESDDLLFCGYTSPSKNGRTGYAINYYAELWDDKTPSTSLSRIQLSVEAGKATVISIQVPRSFDVPNSNGFATFTTATEKTRGGHLVHVVGMIDNTTLASILPDAPAGAGGGYLIIKNSWSPCWADGGYIYLPYDWIKKYTYSAVSLGQ